MNSTIVNATFDNAISAGSSAGVLLTLGLMVGIILTGFILFRFFRKFLRGSIVLSVLVGVYKLADWISDRALVDNDFNPLKWAGKVAGFIVLSVIAGWLIGKNKKVQKWESEISGVLGK